MNMIKYGLKYVAMAVLCLVVAVTTVALRAKPARAEGGGPTVSTCTMQANAR